MITAKQVANVSEIPLFQSQEQMLRARVEWKVMSKNDHKHHHVEQGHDCH